MAKIKTWVEVACPLCGGPARRETDTMPNWAGSSWYYLRYIDPENTEKLADLGKLKYWSPVDWYNGGMEHTTLHLLYSRFWHKFLFDLGVVPTLEPYAKRTSHGVVLGPDGKRMSKSRGNVINPDEIVAKYGADTLRMYEMFMGPFDQMVAWNQATIEGVHRFLKRMWGLAQDSMLKAQSSNGAKARVALLVKKIDEDLESMKFNTAVSAAMEMVNWWKENKGEMGRDMAGDVIKALAPLAPFITEELWEKLGHKESVHVQAWPEYDERLIMEDRTTMVVQVNGKMREKIELENGRAGEREIVQQLALESDNVRKYVGRAKYRVIFVPGKIINFVKDDE